MNVASVVLEHAADQRALIADDGSITSYGRLRALAADLQGELRDRGVGDGDSVALAIGNDVDFVVASIAILGLGAVVTPLNPTSPLPELVRKLEVSRACLLLIGRAGSDYVDCGDETGVDCLDLTTRDTSGVGDDGELAVVERADGDSAFHMATSGVSGDAKVAVLSHGNLDWAQRTLLATEPILGPDDVSLGVLPFAHIFGLNVVLLTSLRAGSTVILQDRFDAERTLLLVREHGVSLLTGAPPMWQRWAAADVPDDSMRSVRFAGSGAAALPLGVWEQVRDRFGVEISQGYGLTETSPIVTSGRGHEVRPSSVGVPVEGCDVALVDADGTPVDVGDEGEIVIRSPGVFQGYLGDRESTDAVLSEDGWLWTGDVGIFDDDGYLYLVDRIKDIVIVSGFNVYPAEVETALMRHPGVSGAIVTGTADVKTGETVVAHVSGSATEDELRAHAEAHLSRYKRPTQYHFVDELPIAPNGKAIRRALR